MTERVREDFVVLSKLLWIFVQNCPQSRRDRLTSGAWPPWQALSSESHLYQDFGHPQLDACRGVVERAQLKLAFEGCLCDLDRRELTRGSDAVAVGPQVFDLLAYLLQNRTRVVSKQELIDAVWGGRIVSESTLTSHINAVRRAIGDSGEEQRLLRTIARKGY